jgi:hypothetical protein
MTPLKEHPDHLAAVAEHNQLSAAVSMIETRIRELELLLAAGQDTPEDKEAAQVAAAKHFVATGEVRGLSNDPNLLREEHVLLRDQRDATKKAMTATFDKVMKITDRLSTEASIDNGAAHRAIAAEYAAALEQARAAEEKERELIRSMHAAGYEARFPMLVESRVVGPISDPQSVLGRHFTAIQRYAKK